MKPLEQGEKLILAFFAGIWVMIIPLAITNYQNEWIERYEIYKVPVHVWDSAKNEHIVSEYRYIVCDRKYEKHTTFDLERYKEQPTDSAWFISYDAGVYGKEVQLSEDSAELCLKLLKKYGW